MFGYIWNRNWSVTLYFPGAREFDFVIKKISFVNFHLSKWIFISILLLSAFKEIIFYKTFSFLGKKEKRRSFQQLKRKKKKQKQL